MAEDWRRLQNEEFHNLYTSPNIVKVKKLWKIIREGHVSRMGQMRNSCNILVGKSEGKRQLGRPKRR
jgi:hypothetical protein